ncbi:MAG: CocE/NonD family hydrolase [Candidatus Hodarchaeota archaeon]
MDKNSPFDLEKINSLEYKYEGYETSSHHIEMRDGVFIAADVLVPKGLPDGEKITTVLHLTRYWRAKAYNPPFNLLMKEPFDPQIARELTAHGYAFILMDVRGTGASSGTRPYPISKEEILDGNEIMDWIIAQEWSDGNVVLYGNSYSAMIAECVVSLNHPALKAVICKHDPWDIYDHAAFPGGCFNNKFLGYWSELGKGLDTTKGVALKAFLPVYLLNGILGPLAVKGVKPVEPVNCKVSLEEVAKIHEGNNYPHDYMGVAEFKDDPITADGTSFNDISIFSYKEEIEKSKLPLYTVGSWFDSASADIVIARFLTYGNPQRAIIGDWDHKKLHRASPFHSHHESYELKRLEQIKDWKLFYDECLTGQFKNEKILYYYTMGAERWNETRTWPPENQVEQPWYLNPHHCLSLEIPGDDEGTDYYKVDYNIGTGIRNRWYSLLSLPIKYPRRKSQDERMLAYTSEPLPEDIEITGHPVVILFLSTTHEDGMVVVYLEFIDEKGKIHVITEGQLRFMHRKISSSKPPYAVTFPYHSFKKKDALPVKSGEMMELTFALFPTSILLKKGYKIRISIGGADKDNFARYPVDGDPTLSIYRSKVNPSRIILPIVRVKT